MPELKEKDWKDDPWLAGLVLVSGVLEWGMGEKHLTGGLIMRS